MEKGDATLFCKINAPTSHGYVDKRVASPYSSVLALWGTADKTTPFDHTRLMQRDIPQVEIYPIEGGSHGIPLSHADEITEAVLEFLQN